MDDSHTPTPGAPAPRNEAGTHEFRLSPAEFEELSRYFEPPTPAEGFDMVVHPWP